MSYANLDMFNPNSVLQKALTEKRHIERTIINNHDLEIILRKQHASLQNAWDQYQIVLQLVKEEK